MEGLLSFFLCVRKVLFLANYPHIIAEVKTDFLPCLGFKLFVVKMHVCGEAVDKFEIFCLHFLCSQTGI